MGKKDLAVNKSDASHPILLLPKNCTMLETTCNATDNVFIDLNISSHDNHGNNLNIYTGYCNVKLLDNCTVDVVHEIEAQKDSNNVLGEITLADSNDMIDYNDNQSEVLIDPMSNPYVNNSYGAIDAKGHCSVYESDREQITVRRRNTFVTHNFSGDLVNYSPFKDLEHKRFGRVHMGGITSPYFEPTEDELECGLFLSQLPGEILTANESKARKEKKFMDQPSNNDALKQLMSADMQEMTKQQRTILYLGNNSSYGQTIQTIAVNDPKMICVQSDHNVRGFESPGQKLYQCNKCKQMFNQISEFRNHIQISHTQNDNSDWTKATDNKDWNVSTDVDLICKECGKHLKTKEKYAAHCKAHGDPELECQMCRKVFASKFTLRNHNKIHQRKHKCEYCKKSFEESHELKHHLEKMHFVYKCKSCNFSSTERASLLEHKKEHHSSEESDSEPDVTALNDWSPDDPNMDYSLVAYESLQSAEEMQETDPDKVLAKVMSDEVFHLHSKAARKHRSYNKACSVCGKPFDRVSDLKRHLIEHVIRSTLAKSPATSTGALAIQCEVCRAHTFSRVDKYKAHLREHAKLTIYKCTFCDKTFSDSSNFSKHKKIHGTAFFQCDLCQRKFNTKKTLVKHIQFHNENGTQDCVFCGRKFHFLSKLRRHIKSAHATLNVTRMKCRFCDNLFGSLKCRWNHEWITHKVRKMIVDCLICGAKFRKYSELKLHCKQDHSLKIPSAKKLLELKRWTL